MINICFELRLTRWKNKIYNVHEEILYIFIGVDLDLIEKSV